MAVETAFRSLEDLGVTDKHTILIHGAGSMVGFAAVQIALLRGAKVIATAGETFAPKLRKLGATVTAYGEGMVERVREIAGGSPDLILDTAPISGALPDLVKIADGDAQRVLTISDFAAAKELGARDSFTKSKHDAAARFDQDGKDVAKAAADFLRYDILGDYAKLAAEGKFSVPIARTYALKDWRQAMEVSQSGNPHGKIMILPTE